MGRHRRQARRCSVSPGSIMSAERRAGEVGGCWLFQLTPTVRQSKFWTRGKKEVSPTGPGWLWDPCPLRITYIYNLLGSQVSPGSILGTLTEYKKKKSFAAVLGNLPPAEDVLLRSRRKRKSDWPVSVLRATLTLWAQLRASAGSAAVEG